MRRTQTGGPGPRNEATDLPARGARAGVQEGAGVLTASHMRQPRLSTGGPACAAARQAGGWRGVAAGSASASGSRLALLKTRFEPRLRWRRGRSLPRFLRSATFVRPCTAGFFTLRVRIHRSYHARKEGRARRPSLRAWRRGRDSNPRYAFGRTHAFQACSLNRSDTSPDMICAATGQTGRARLNQPAPPGNAGGARLAGYASLVSAFSPPFRA